MIEQYVASLWTDLPLTAKVFAICAGLAANWGLGRVTGLATRLAVFLAGIGLAPVVAMLGVWWSTPSKRTVAAQKREDAERHQAEVNAKTLALLDQIAARTVASYPESGSGSGSAYGETNGPDDYRRSR